MPLLRAISTLGCPELTLEGVAALVKSHGLDAAELRCIDGTMDLPLYFREKYGTEASLAGLVAKLDLKIVSLDTSFALIGQTEAQRQEFLHFVPWAEALGIKSLRIFDGGKSGSDQEFLEAAATYTWWNSLRQENGWKVDLIVETHDLLFTTPLIHRFLSAVPNAAILWDTHHTWKRGGEDPLVTWSAIKSHVRHIHVKDSISKPSDKHPHTYVLPGNGEFPIAPILAQLAKDGFSGPVSLEWEKRWHPYLPSLDEALTNAALKHWW